LAVVCTSCLNSHEFRYDAVAPINSGSQITLVSDKSKYGSIYQARANKPDWYELIIMEWMPLDMWGLQDIEELSIWNRMFQER